MQQAQFIRSDEVVKFVRDNFLHTDIKNLLLNPPVEFKEHIGLIVDQIVSRRKAKTKLPHWFDNYELIMPPPLSLEQCSSPATAAYKQQLIQGKRLADLTGGMGVDTLSLSETFPEVHHVEINPELHTIFQHNIATLGKDNITAHQMSAERFMLELKEKSCFYIDPARRDKHQSRVFKLVDCSPNITELMPYFRVKANQVLIKAAPMIDISHALLQLEAVKDVHVVSVKNEVKEVLFLLDFQTTPTKNPNIHCVNLDTNQPEFSFTLAEEKSSNTNLSSLKKYLYDPNSAILKAGAFKLVGFRNNLTKLATHTHLYTSNQLNSQFPGRVFEVLQPSVNKKKIHQLLPKGQANVITKNFPQKPDELKKKLKVKDGGGLFLIGFRDVNNSPNICLVHAAK